MRRLLALLVLLFASSAQASHVEILRWTLAEPPVANGFRVHWAVAGGDFTAVDVGLVTKNPEGEFIHSIVVPDQNIYFYVVAYNEGGSSQGSNQICRDNGSPCVIAPPPPNPPALHAYINGFVLWDATTDQKTITNLVSGNSFQPGCVSIEIRGNKYLRDNLGSVRKTFDGQSPATNACENRFPFGWEDGDLVGQWPCAESLNAVGIHTLTVTPFDGKDCTGTQGKTVSVAFGVGVLPEPGSAGLVAGILMLMYLSRRRYAH